MKWLFCLAVVPVLFVYLWSYKCMGHHNLGSPQLCRQTGRECFEGWHFILSFSFMFPAAAAQLCSHWPDAVHWMVLLYRSLWFWHTVLCNKPGWNHHCHLQRLMKRCLIPADLTWFPPRCSLLFSSSCCYSSDLEWSVPLPFLPLFILHCSVTALLAILHSITIQLLKCSESTFHNITLMYLRVRDHWNTSFHEKHWWIFFFIPLFQYNFWLSLSLTLESECLKQSCSSVRPRFIFATRVTSVTP